MTNSYSFVAPCSKMIDTDEIYENINREFPLAVLKNDNGEVCVYTHYTLWSKGECMDVEYRKELSDALIACKSNVHGFFTPQGGNLQRVIDAARAIKTGPLEESAVSTTITVELLKL